MDSSDLTSATFAGKLSAKKCFAEATFPQLGVKSFHRRWRTVHTAQITGPERMRKRTADDDSTTSERVRRMRTPGRDAATAATVLRSLAAGHPEPPYAIGDGPVPFAT